MKIAGTLKAEIIKPLNGSWEEVGDRMHAMRRSLGHALNLTMRDFQPQAVAEIQARRHKDKVDTSWRQKIEPTLRSYWNSELAASLENLKNFKKRKKEPNPRAYLPVMEYISAETIDVLLSRFTGEHLKDLMQAKSSLPSWKENVSFAARQRNCMLEGKANNATITFPLWGAGKKVTKFAIAPAGGSQKARWNELVRDFNRRSEIVALEKQLKDKKFSKEERAGAQKKLETLGATKLGKVGITYDKRKRKWFVLITWTKHQPDPTEANKKAVALNFGCNVFLQALSECGETWEDPGFDIRVTRERFWKRRKTIQKSLNHLGKGSRGHGKKRKFLPVTKLEDKESRWVETRIRNLAADFVKWCVFHNITDVYLEDLSSIRDTFEQNSNGEAHEQVKRFIHNWPFYKTRQAIEYECMENGIRCHAKSTKFNSQRCPSCGHTHEDNVKMIRGGGDYIVHNGKSYRHFENWTRFQCEKCGLRHKGDVVTCANHLVEVGCTHTLEKTQSKARKRTKSKIKEIQATE